MARTYEKLTEDYRIAYYGLKEYKNGEWVPINPDDYDVIIECIGPGYATKKYHIIKRPTDVTNDELCEICDRGSYNFGYRMEGSTLVVYVD